MSTSSTPMFCLLVKAPISSQIKTARVNGHNTSGPLCALRLFTPYHLIQFVLPCPFLSGPSSAVNVTVLGISSCSLAAYPSPANSASSCFEAENSCGSPFNSVEALSWCAAVFTEARSTFLLYSTGSYVAQNGDALVSRPCWMLIVYPPHPTTGCLSVLDPVRELCGSP